MRRGFAAVGSVAVLLVVGFVGYVAAAAVLPIGGEPDPTTVIVRTGTPGEEDCSQTQTTPFGEVGPSNSGCAGIEIRLDGTCVVDFPVDDAMRRALAEACPNGVSER